MNAHYECLYDVAWQLRRWSYQGAFDKEETTRGAISDMLTYIGKAKTPYWKFIRVWRCRNVAIAAKKQAEMAGNKTGVWLLKKFSKGLEIEYNRYKDKHGWSPKKPLFHQWNWVKVREDLQKLYREDRDMFRALLHHTSDRVHLGGKQNPTELASRPEIQRFLREMRDVEFDGT